MIREVEAMQTLCSRYLAATSAREKGGHFLYYVSSSVSQEEKKGSKLKTHHCFDSSPLFLSKFTIHIVESRLHYSKVLFLRAGPVRFGTGFESPLDRNMLQPWSLLPLLMLTSCSAVRSFQNRSELQAAVRGWEFEAESRQP